MSKARKLKFRFSESDGSVKWDTKGEKVKEIKLGEVATELIKGKLKEMDEFNVLQLKKSLHRHVTPLVEMEPTSASMAIKAADSILNTVNNKNEIPKQIVFIGAASLQTPPEGLDENDIIDYEDVEDESKQSPHQIYRGALEAASTKSVRIVRFVNLFSADHSSTRSKSVQSDYVKWLKNQYNQIARNPNFIIIDSPRVPRWGAGGARIITYDTVIDLTHKEGCALFIRDPFLAQTQSDLIYEDAFSAMPANIRIIRKEWNLEQHEEFPNQELFSNNNFLHEEVLRMEAIFDSSLT